MWARVITLHCNAVLGGFDDTALREFLKDKVRFTFSNHMDNLALDSDTLLLVV